MTVSTCNNAKIVTSPRTRNLTLECMKMIAAIMVVFIHAEFPGGAGSMVVSLSRFAVPLFFAVSGYFNYKATHQQVLRRMLHILKLNIAAIVLYVLWSCYTAGVDSLGSAVSYILPDTTSLIRWMHLHVSPYAIAEPMWFLTSLVVTYGVFWLYVRFYDGEAIHYRPIYGAGFVLFAIYFTLVIILSTDGMTIPYQSYRNGWLLGIPMFLMGLFFREYGEHILEKFRLNTRKLSLLTLLGVLLTLLQWKSGYASEMTLGTLVTVTALLLLAAEDPITAVCPQPVRRLLSRFGPISTGIYIIHPLLVNIYDQSIRPVLSASLDSAEPWLRPVIILAASLLSGVLWERTDSLLKTRKKKSA